MLLLRGELSRPPIVVSRHPHPWSLSGLTCSHPLRTRLPRMPRRSFPCLRRWRRVARRLPTLGGARHIPAYQRSASLSIARATSDWSETECEGSLGTTSTKQAAPRRRLPWRCHLIDIRARASVVRHSATDPAINLDLHSEAASSCCVALETFVFLRHALVCLLAALFLHLASEGRRARMHKRDSTTHEPALSRIYNIPGPGGCM